MAFRGGATGVHIDKLPCISYCKFLPSSVCKLCQSLTVSAEIIHARCLPQADFFFDSFIENVSVISNNKIREKYFVLSTLKIFQLLRWKALALPSSQFGTRLSFRHGITFVNIKSVHTTSSKVWKTTVCTCLEETCFATIYFESFYIGHALFSLSFCKVTGLLMHYSTE